MLSPNSDGQESVGGTRTDRFFRWFGNDPIYERWRWQVFLVTWAAYAGLALTRKPFVVAKVEIGEGTAVGLTGAQLAWIDGAFLAAYAAGQFLWGIAGDRWGTRKVVLTGMLCSVLAGVAMGGVNTAVAFGVVFFIQGLCQSCGWAPLLKNIGNFFSRRERGFIVGLWCTNYAIGGLAASVFAGYVGQLLGWRWAFFAPAGALLIIWFLFAKFQRNDPEEVGLPPVEEYHREPQSVIQAGDTEADEPAGSWGVIGQVIANPMILLLGMAYFFLKPARYAILFWSPMYLTDRLDTGMGEAGFLSGLFELAGPVSILLAGFVSDRLFKARRIPVSTISMALLAGMLLLFDHLPRTPWVLGCGMFLMGFFVHAPDMLIGGVAAVDFGTKKGASTASGIINAVGSVGAIIGGVLPGFLIARFGWEVVFNLLGGSVVIAVLLLLPKWGALPPESAQPRAPGPGRS